MSKVITQDNEQVIQIYNRLKDTLTRLENILKSNNPTLNGHRYMNDAEWINVKTCGICWLSINFS